MKEYLLDEVKDLIIRYPKLKSVEYNIVDALLLMIDSYRNGGKVLVAGNGGSASDAQHIVGELMKSFKQSRPISDKFASKLQNIDKNIGIKLSEELEMVIPAISLTAHESLTTAYVNDVGGESIFAQQLFGYGKSGDIFLGISTSGNSENIVRAAVVAKAMNIKVIGLTGNSGGRLARFCDVIVNVPESETYMIQELHLPIYHWWCRVLENKIYE